MAWKHNLKFIQPQERSGRIIQTFMHSNEQAQNQTDKILIEQVKQLSITDENFMTKW